MQFCEIIFSILQLSKSGLLGSIIQVCARVLNTYWTYDIDTPTYIIFQTMICWSSAETIRSLYYLNKDSIVLSTIRYNAFLILYPIGAFGEVLAYENYLNNHKDLFWFMRLVQTIFILGFFYMYYHMFIQRGKFYKRLKLEQEKNE